MANLPARRGPNIEPEGLIVGHGNENLGRGTHGKPKPAASPAVVPTMNPTAGHGNSIHCHSGNRNCPDVSGNSRSSRSRSTLDGFSPRFAQAAITRR